MIELKISSMTDEAGAIYHLLTPEQVSLGVMDGNNVNVIHIETPEEWVGKAVRFTILPDTGDSVAIILPESGEVNVTADMISSRNGRFVVDAVDDNDYIAYTTTGYYTAITHATAGGSDPAPTPTEYQQFVADTLANKNAVEEAAKQVSEDKQDVTKMVEAFTTEEQDRVAAEKQRATAESARATAESARFSAESGRASAETGRSEAETSRASSESGRVTAEQQRVANEEARATAETSRASAESERVSAENACKSNELARIEAENARVSAETERVTAEQQRETDTADAVAACTAALEGLPSLLDDQRIAIEGWVTEHFMPISGGGGTVSSTLKITFSSDFAGETYTVTDGNGESYTGIVPDTLVVEQAVQALDTTYTVSCVLLGCINYTKTVDVGMYYGLYPLEFFSFLAYLTCSSDPLATITATNENATFTGQADSTGSCTLDIKASGTYAVTATLNGETTEPVSVEIATFGETYTCNFPYLFVPSVPFATGTDAEIAAMLDAAKAGSFDLQADGGWAVGDVRTIPISALTGGGSVAHAAQSIDIVITSFDDYNDCGAVMQFDFKDELAAGNRMNASKTNAGGYGSSEMYSTTLPALVNALPTWLKDRLLEFSVLSSAGSQSSTINTVTGNKLALRSEMEILGTATYSKAGEGTQIPYYATSANCFKKRGHNGSSGSWWTRSPNGSDATRFCFLYPAGISSGEYASTAVGVAPFGCI